MIKFKAEIKIPKGYKRIEEGYIAIKDDFCLMSNHDVITPILEWQEWTDIHIVKKGEIFIRKL